MPEDDCPDKATLDEVKRALETDEGARHFSERQRWPLDRDTTRRLKRLTEGPPPSRWRRFWEWLIDGN